MERTQDIDTSWNLLITEDQKFQTLLGTLKGCEEFVLDADGIIKSTNLEAVTITGYEEWEVIGRSFSIFYTPKDQLSNRLSEDLTRASKRNYVVSTGFKIKKKGTQFWAKTKFTCLYSGDGEVAGYRIELQDTTHRAMYTLTTKRMKDEYLNLLNNSFIGIVKFRTKDNSCLLLNDKAKSILNCSTATNLYLNDLFYSHDDYLSFLQALRQYKRVENFEFRLKASDTEATYCSFSCRAFPVGGFIEGIIVNITEKRNRIAELEQLNNELDNFIYRASHDLRSPLTTMMGLVNLIQTEKSVDMIQVYNSKLGDRINHLDSLLRDLSKVAYNNSQPLELVEIQAESLVEEIVRVYRPVYSNVRVTIRIFSKFNFLGDPIRIATILNNILSNAFKFQNPNEPNPRVEIYMGHKDDRLLIQVSDNGRGIAPNYKKEIFKLFFRADSIGSGSGLGLYVVKEILTKLNGVIAVKSDIGKGTSVSISVPAQIVCRGPKLPH